MNRTLVRRLLAVVVTGVVLGFLLSFTGCAKRLPTDPPQIKADQVLVWVDTFQAGVLANCGVDPVKDPTLVCRPPLDTASAREMIGAATTLRAILKASATGWQAAVRAGWASMRPRFDTVQQPYAIWVLLVAIDALVQAL